MRPLLKFIPCCPATEFDVIMEPGRVVKFPAMLYDEQLISYQLWKLVHVAAGQC